VDKLTANFNEQIISKEAESDNLKIQLEEVRSRFIDVSIKFIQEWYQQTTESYVKRKAEHTLSLGEEKLSQMKLKVNKLVEDADKIAREFLSDESIWCPLQEVGNSTDIFRKIGKKLDAHIRLALGRLGVILEEFGYVLMKPTDSFASGVWLERDSSGHHLRNARPYYPFAMQMSDEMNEIMKEYEKLCRRAREKLREIALLRREKQEYEAMELWKKV